MTSIIIDDEVHCIGALELTLRDCDPTVEIVATCRSGNAGIQAISAHQPELVFLDIAMPGMNGFEMLSQIEEPSFEIIFTTAYDEYALQAMKVSAVDYLLKPVDFDELAKALEKVRRRIAAKRALQSDPTDLAGYWSKVIENMRSNAERYPNIAFPTSNGYEMVRASDILYLEADGNYARIFLRDQPSLFISKTLKDMQDTLKDYNFVRVHHSHLVNRKAIKRYVRGEGGYVVLDNDKHIAVSRRRKPELLRALKNS